MTFIYGHVKYISYECAIFSNLAPPTSCNSADGAARAPLAGCGARCGGWKLRAQRMHEMPAGAGRCASLHKDGQNRSSSRHPGFSEANVLGTTST